MLEREPKKGKSGVSGGALKFLSSIITWVLRVVARPEQFSQFSSSSKALSEDISLTLKLKTTFSPFW